MDVPKRLYPFAEHWLELEPGVRMHYVDEGPRDGPVVVMLHGNPTWSFYWRRLIKALAPTHRVIAPDHIGCGKSDKPDDERYPYTITRRIADVERLVESLALRDLTLMVHDWGGMIGMGWAHRHPELVTRLVLLNTAAFGLPPTKRMPASLWLARNTGLGAVLVRGFNAFARGATRLCVTRRPLPAEIREALCAPYDSWDNRRAVLRFVQDIPLRPGDPGFELLGEVGDALGQFDDRPTLICWGLRDFVFDEHFLRVWEQKLPSADVHRFADSGHYVLEDAGEEIEGLVLRFLGVAG
ncbi:Haloalkane dehalogenase [Enhygromyxa salina]|uniref:Haloalkane dehalogenase n=1 Tax=Enhygromyxa salina TaxID=215803 RepID=A0A2S9XZI2_9BACT|nr:alpha/beta fold hydrolase [Enhygromyxa salina]PRP98272.1 Haloalkane dehalogenase [Enhygromyxa salina]